MTERERISAAAAGDRSLSVDWADGHRSEFHYVWLRYNCACERCGDLDSGIGTLLLTDIPADIDAASVAVEEAGALAVEWAHDAHRSRYDPAWLRAHCYSEAERERRRHRPTLWDAGIAERLPEADYGAVIDDEGARLRMFEQVRDLGFARVRAAPTTEEGLERLAALFGHLLEWDLPPRLQDLRSSPTRTVVTDTPLAIPKHTDLCYRHAPSGIQFFQCVSSSAGGGETLLGDGFRIAAELRRRHREAFELLGRVPLQFHRYIEGRAAYYAEGRAIALDERGEVAGFRYANRVTAAPVDVPAELVEPVHDALRELVTLMNDPELEVRFLLEPGDILVFDNHRVLHGRTAYDDAQGRRHLRRCEVAREAFHSRLRVLMQRLGRTEAKHLVLAHGALG